MDSETLVSELPFGMTNSILPWRRNVTSLFEDFSVEMLDHYAFPAVR